MDFTDRHALSRLVLPAVVPLHHHFSYALIFTLLLAVHTLFTVDSATSHGCRIRQI